MRRDVGHIQTVRVHQLLDTGVAGAALQLIEERLMRIDAVHRFVQRRGQGQGLAARSAAGVDDQLERPVGQQSQHVGGGLVAAGTKLAHAAEQQRDGIIGHRAIVRPPSSPACPGASTAQQAHGCPLADSGRPK